MLGFATHSSFSFFYKKGGDGLENLTRALVMVDPLHQSSLLYVEYMTVIVDARSALQYQTVVSLDWTPVPDCRV